MSAEKAVRLFEALKFCGKPWKSSGMVPANPPIRVTSSGDCGRKRGHAGKCGPCEPSPKGGEG